MNPETQTKSNPAPSQAGQRGSLSVTDCSASDLIDALDMMRDEFQRIIACPGCNAEIEDLANRAQLKLIQHVPVIVQRDRAEAEVSRLRTALQAIADEANKHHEHNHISGKDRLPRGYINILNLADAALHPPNPADEPRRG